MSVNSDDNSMRFVLPSHVMLAVDFGTFVLFFLMSFGGFQIPYMPERALVLVLVFKISNGYSKYFFQNITCNLLYSFSLLIVYQKIF